MEIDFLLDFLRVDGMPDQINEFFQGSQDFVDHVFARPSSVDVLLDVEQNVCIQYFQGLQRFCVKCLGLVPRDNPRIVVQIMLLSFIVYVWVVYDVVLLDELFRIVHSDLSLTGNWTFFYVNGNFQVEVHVLNIFVQEKQSTRIYLQVSV